MQSPVCLVDKIETALRGVLRDAAKVALKAVKGTPRGDKAQKCPDRLLTKYLGFMGKAPHRARVKARPRVFVALLVPSKHDSGNKSLQFPGHTRLNSGRQRESRELWLPAPKFSVRLKIEAAQVGALQAPRRR